MDILEVIEELAQERNVVTYDFYVTVKIETEKALGDIAFKIRSIEGVLDFLTCCARADLVKCTSIFPRA